jgi:hypothetical protein
MGQTPRYGLRFPETTDPAEAWTAVGNLAADVELILEGTAVTITAAQGWADLGQDWPIYARSVAGRQLRLSGLLKRTGAPVTTNSTGYHQIATVGITPTWAVTGITMASTGLVRWQIGRDGSVGIMTAPGQPAVTIATNSFLSLDGMNGRV